MKILVVEDEKKVASFIKRGLEDDNYKVAVAYDGLDGYKQARDGEYNLVIMDMMLPKKDGMAVIKDLRESGNRVPVLMLTARDNM
jgi:DNA-binding response OmpR family regulator